MEDFLMNQVKGREEIMTEEKVSPKFYFSHKEIIETGALIALLKCRTCGESFTLGDLLDQLGKEERIAFKERINATLFLMKGESEP
jgi:hypothetical protein